MAETTPERPLSEEEKKLAEQAGMAESKSKIAKAELEIAEAKKKLEALNQPPNEKELAGLQEAIATSNQKAIQAGRDSWKGPEVKAPEGKITAEGTFIESQILAGHTLYSAMVKLVNSINEKSPFKSKPLIFVIYNAADIPTIELYTNMLLQLAYMKNCFGEANTAAKTALNGLTGGAPAGGAADPLLVGFAAAGIVRTVADFLSLFKKDTQYKNFDVTIDETSLVASFVQAAVTKGYGWTVFYPAAYPIDTVNAVNTVASPLIAQLHAIRQLNTELQKSIGQIDQALTTRQLALAAEADPGKKETLVTQIDTLQKAKDNVQSLPIVFGQLETMLSTVDATTKNPLLSSLVRAQRIVNRLSGDDNTYVIKLGASSKGSYRIISSLFRSATIKYSGGTELSCLIFGKDGHIVFAENIRSYMPYQDSAEISAL